MSYAVAGTKGSEGRTRDGGKRYKRGYWLLVIGYWGTEGSEERETDFLTTKHPASRELRRSRHESRTGSF